MDRAGRPADRNAAVVLVKVALKPPIVTVVVTGRQELARRRMLDLELVVVLNRGRDIGKGDVVDLIATCCSVAGDLDGRGAAGNPGDGDGIGGDGFTRIHAVLGRERKNRRRGSRIVASAGTSRSLRTRQWSWQRQRQSSMIFSWLPSICAHSTASDAGVYRHLRVIVNRCNDASCCRFPAVNDVLQGSAGAES